VAKPAQYFRAGTGAMIINADGRVLAIERADIPGAWQLPQGGLEGSEEPLEAAYREILEETNIPKERLQPLEQQPLLLTYELPADVRREKTGRGQVLYWFPFRFLGTDDVITVGHGGESSHWKWMPMASVVKSVVGFRRPMYEQLAKEFTKHL
jgi:putative (di)nucleoside polyphosphate hydrolase